MIGYTILDILAKLIMIEKRGYDIYHSISLREEIDERLRMVARILKDQESKHMDLYKKIKKTAEKDVLPSIDFDIYDQASQLLSNFTPPSSLHIMNIQQLLQFAHNFEKQNLALVISIQGLLVRGPNVQGSITYNVLTQIIEEGKKHIKNIERFIR